MHLSHDYYVSFIFHDIIRKFYENRNIS